MSTPPPDDRTRRLPPPASGAAPQVTGEQARVALRGLRREAKDAPRKARLWTLVGIAAAILIALAGAGTAIVKSQDTAAQVATDEATGAVAESRAASLPVLRGELADDNAKIAARNLGPGLPPPANATTDDYRRRIAALDAVLYLADLDASRGQGLPGDTQSPVPGQVGGGALTGPDGTGSARVSPIPSTSGIPGLTTAPTVPRSGSSGGAGGSGGGGAASGDGGAAPSGGGSSTGTTSGPTGGGSAGGKAGGEPAPPPAPLLPLLPLPLQLPGVHVNVSL